MTMFRNPPKIPQNLPYKPLDKLRISCYNSIVGLRERHEASRLAQEGKAMEDVEGFEIETFGVWDQLEARGRNEDLEDAWDYDAYESKDWDLECDEGPEGEEDFDDDDDEDEWDEDDEDYDDGGDQDPPEADVRG